MTKLVNRWALAAYVVCMAVAITSCQNTGPAESTSAPAVPATTTEPPQQWTMPNLVGSGLQEAQNQIQTITGGKVIITTSHDATGQNRGQVVDSNWKVCTQSIAAGEQITRRSTIDFGAVKLSESCP